MIIKRLWTHHPPAAEATDLLGLPAGADGLVDISADQWAEFVVLEDLAFTSIKLAKVDLGVRFKQCTFDRCTFAGVRTEDNLLGTNCRWRDCRFESVTAVDASSPMNLFEGCVFDHLRVRGYRPYQTLFRGCRFRNLSLRKLRVNPVRSSSRLPELSGHAQNLVFIDCTFERPTFVNCFFNSVAFQQCRVSEPIIKSCRFTGAVGDPPWWRPSDHTDPIRSLWADAVAEVESRLGRETRSYQILAAHLAEYDRNPHMGEQYPGELTSVSREEFNAVDEILGRLMAVHGL